MGARQLRALRPGDQLQLEPLERLIPPAIVGATATGPRFGNQFVTYESLMLSDDGRGNNRGFLASEASFQFLKSLEERNKIIPVVGDFGGMKAIKAVAGYLKSIHATVSAFYLSNVEQFLVRGGTYFNFCRSVSMRPARSSDRAAAGPLP